MSAPRRFVVLRHEVPPERAAVDGRGSHYDLMIESGEALATWAIPRWPLAPGESVAALKLAPHRREYLEYEGPVSGNRGTVTRVAAGTCVPDAEELVGDGPQLGAAFTGRMRMTSPQWSGVLSISRGSITAEY